MMATSSRNMLRLCGFYNIIFVCLDGVKQGEGILTGKTIPKHGLPGYVQTNGMASAGRRTPVGANSKENNVFLLISLQFPTGTRGPFRGFCDHTYN
jgi:hypothetical protein